ncbi:hypothetical protein V6N13_021040 [Hibiscus sabdariffa]|uniref:Uncharacterized protein n=1 Tax=Hibiscus sabdariffa TaxID=183260 RepID=A0ABR2EXA1_9ROSI
MGKFVWALHDSSGGEDWDQHLSLSPGPIDAARVPRADVPSSLIARDTCTSMGKRRITSTAHMELFVPATWNEILVSGNGHDSL